MTDRYKSRASTRADQRRGRRMTDLIERLRAVKWEEADDGERSPDDPTHKCVFVDMRPAEFQALLRKAAAALEAARKDAERLDWLAGDALMISGLGEHGTWETPALLVGSTREACTPRDFRAAIDQARGKENGNG